MTSIHTKKEQSITVETITPEIAKMYLAMSKGNRNLRADQIAQLARAMADKTYIFNGSPIRFDADGVLVDGHHRLSACILAEVSFVTVVIRNLPEKAVVTIDTGMLVRTVADRLRMEGGINNNNAAALTAVIAWLISGTKVALRTLDLYNEWTAAAEGGHKFALEHLIKVRFMRNATVAGAFAFAYKADPEAVAKFAFRVRDGEGLTRTEPAFALREFLMLQAGGHKRPFKQTQTDVAYKVLNAIYACLHKQTRQKLAVNVEAYEFFRSFYSRGAAAKTTKETLTMRNAARRLIETQKKEAEKTEQVA